MLVGLSGYAGAGKDTVGEILVRDHGFKRIAIADALRTAALKIDPIVGRDDRWRVKGSWVIDLESQSGDVRLSELVERYGWDTAKREYPEVRRLLQQLGDAAKGLGWNSADAIPNRGRGHYRTTNVVVTDVRFLEEFNRIWDQGGVIWRVRRPGVSRASDHPSETAAERLPYNRLITNKGSIAHLTNYVGLVLAEKPQR